MRTLLALALSSTGCAALFQDKLPSDYRGTSEPRCDTAGAPVVFDVIEAAIDAIAIGITAASKNPDAATLVGGALDGIIFGASAGIGIKEGARCDEARDNWDKHIAAIAAHQEQLEREVRQSHAAPVVEPYCFAYTLDGIAHHQCSVALEICQAKRRLLEPNTPGIGDCADTRAPHVVAPVVVAPPAASEFCFGYTDDGKPVSKCMPTMDSCRKAREPIAAVTEGVSECTEKR